jgi:hypothetical protein
VAPALLIGPVTPCGPVVPVKPKETGKKWTFVTGYGSEVDIFA